MRNLPCFGRCYEEKRKKVKDRREVIELRREKKKGREGSRLKRRRPGREEGDIGQHIKFRAEFLNPLGGDTELKKERAVIHSQFFTSTEDKM